jgi:ribosomal protein S18 acetylase RimI-like enzyme
MPHVRPYVRNDRSFVLSLAPRLAIGKQPWRDLALWLKTVEEWLTESINQHNQKTMVLIGEDEKGEQLGFATVSHSTHFTGQPQAYIGELATSEKVEGRGAGSALVEACARPGYGGLISEATSHKNRPGGSLLIRILKFM